MPVPPKQVQPSPGSFASSCRAAGMSAGATRKTIAWWTMSTLPGRNWLPVRNAGPRRPGSTRKQRYSSVPPFGGRGGYARGTVRVVNRSPTSSGALGPVGAVCPCALVAAGVPAAGVPDPAVAADEQPAAAPPPRSASTAPAAASRRRRMPCSMGPAP